MATQQQKTRSPKSKASEPKEITLNEYLAEFQKASEELALDDSIERFAEEQRAGVIVAWVTGIALGLGLIWLELVMLWALTHA